MSQNSSWGSKINLYCCHPTLMLVYHRLVAVCSPTTYTDVSFFLSSASWRSYMSQKTEAEGVYFSVSAAPFLPCSFGAFLKFHYNESKSFLNFKKFWNFHLCAYPKKRNSFRRVCEIENTSLMWRDVDEKLIRHLMAEGGIRVNVKTSIWISKNIFDWI